MSEETASSESAIFDGENGMWTAKGGLVWAESNLDEMPSEVELCVAPLDGRIQLDIEMADEPHLETVATAADFTPDQARAIGERLQNLADSIEGGER